MKTGPKTRSRPVCGPVFTDRPADRPRPCFLVSVRKVGLDNNNNILDNDDNNSNSKNNNNNNNSNVIAITIILIMIIIIIIVIIPIITIGSRCHHCRTCWDPELQTSSV